MKSIGWIRGLAIVLASLGLCLPQSALAAGSNDQTPHVVDVKLHDGGVLLGQVVDPQNVARADVPVSILAGEQQLATAKTRADGYFAFRSLRGGIYQLATPEGHGVYRLWSPGTAPPSAQEGALVVTGGTVRGQVFVNRGIFPHFNCGGRLAFWLSNPWVIGGLVATAVAVPVALHNLDDDEPHSP